MYFPQDEVYRSTTKGLIEGLISGYNATVFAYGPTGQYQVIPRAKQYIIFCSYTEMTSTMAIWPK